MQRPLAPLASAPAVIAGTHHAAAAVPVVACNALGKFIQLIQRDQHARKPGIPSALAKAWLESARTIESQVGCGTLRHHHHGHDSRKNSHGHSSARNHHHR
jgi:hypothetical protein